MTLLVEKYKFLVIYVYYEIPDHQKNQTNLSFFIRHGLDKKRWKNIDMECLFIINGHVCEVIIPNEDFFFILKEDNCTDWEGYLNGINFIKNKFNISCPSQRYDFIFFMNCSIIGPTIPSNKEYHWLEPYLNKIINEKSVICGNIVHNLPETDLGGPGIVISCYNFLLKINNEIIKILTTELISNKNEKSSVKFPVEYNTVFGPKKSKTDAILTGEFGLSRILLKNKYSLSSLFFEPYNYQKGINKTTNINYIDRYGGRLMEYPDDLENINLPVLDMIFYKNIWRWENTRASLPVEYDQCIDLLNSYCNFVIPSMGRKNIYQDKEEIIEYEINYPLLACSDKGITTADPKCDWNNKKEFYNIHGYAEEIMTFPYIIENNKALAIYHHYDSDNIIRDYVIQGIKCLMLSGYDIIFYTSSSTINNITSFPFKINFYPNHGAGTDFICYYDVLSSNIEEFKSKYEWIFLTNDSVAFPICSIDNFKRIIQEQRIRSDFWGHWSSRDLQRHLIGTLIEFSKKTLDFLLSFLKSKLLNASGQIDLTKDKKYFIRQIEVKILDHLCNNGFIVSAAIPYEKFSYIGHKTPVFPKNIYKWINDSNAFAIKWKYMCNYINLNHINNPYLNYLLRYIHFGPNGLIGNYQKESNIDPHKVIELFPDLPVK